MVEPVSSSSRDIEVPERKKTDSADQQKQEAQLSDRVEQKREVDSQVSVTA